MILFNKNVSILIFYFSIFSKPKNTNCTIRETNFKLYYSWRGSGSHRNTVLIFLVECVFLAETLQNTTALVYNLCIAQKDGVISSRINGLHNYFEIVTGTRATSKSQVVNFKCILTGFYYFCYQRQICNNLTGCYRSTPL